MFSTRKPTHHSLDTGSLISIRARASDRLHCRQGRLLITLSGSVQDIDLRAGQSLPVAHDGLLVIEALLPAQIEFQPDTRTRTTHWRARWQALRQRCALLPKEFRCRNLCGSPPA